MLCNKIAEVQNGHMLLMEPSTRIIEEEDSPEQWQIENVDNGMSFGMGMDMTSMSGPQDFNIQQEEASFQDFENQAAESTTSQRSSLSSSHQTADTSQISSLAEQQQPPSFVPFSSWQFRDSSEIIPDGNATFDHSREADLFLQLQQNFNMNINGAFGLTSASAEGVDGINRLMTNGNLWDVGMGMGVERMGGNPGAVEQWN
jgi:hypothetical protein